MPFNGGKLGILNQPSQDTAEGYYSPKDHNLYASLTEPEMVGYAPPAAGGTEADLTVGSTNYKVHTFTSSGNLVVGSTIAVEYLMIAGGGSGGGFYYSGGGGAGGYRTNVASQTSGL